MSGITGIFYRDGAPADPRDLARMMDALAHRGVDGAGTWLNGQAALGCHLLRVTPESESETQPYVSPDGFVAVFDGRLDNRDELFGLLDSTPGIDRDTPDVCLVAALYRQLGDEFISRLIGDFAFGLFDSNRRRLLLGRDVIGIKPLYYVQTGNSLLFGSEIKAILAHPGVDPRPNDAHLAELILLAPPAVDCGLTFFQDISMLGPGHVLVAETERVRISRYWDFDPSLKIRLRSYGEYVEAFRHHLETALRRRMRTPYSVALSLSGGLDSSSLCSLMHEIRRPLPDQTGKAMIRAYSYDSPARSDANEKPFVAELEKKFGFRTEFIPYGPPDIFDGLEDCISTTECPIAESMWTRGEMLLKSVARDGSRVLISGHWGDQLLFDWTYLVDLFREFRWRELRAHTREFAKWFTDVDASLWRRVVRRMLVRSCVPRFLVPTLRALRYRTPRFHRNRPWYTDVFRAAGNRASPRLPAVNCSRYSRSLYETVHSRYYVLGMSSSDKAASRHGVVRAYPFLDRDLVAFLMAIPGEIATHNGVPKALLRDGLTGLLPQKIAARNWKADTTKLEIDAMHEQYSRICQLLTSDCRVVRAGYVDGQALREALSAGREQLNAAEPGTAWDLEYVVGLEIWLRTFFSGDNSC
ncbi:MAG: asparagine synthase-related protein [Gammaproteobacteria bacterium]|nr:asparagine synthase-related protein [Gammaproteobacteria bacterium]